MSTTDPKKIAFRGTTNTDLQKHIDSYFTTLGGINPEGLNYTSFDYYYFIVDSGEIIRASILPAGYIEREPGDYFKDSLGGIKDERKFAFLGSKHPEIQKAILDFFIKLGASNKLQVEGKNVNLYYFIDATNKINNSRDLPEGYIFQLDTYLNVMKNQEEKIPEYVECTKSKNDVFTVGKIYTWPAPLDNNGVTRKISVTCLEGVLWEFKPSTKEAYEAQNTYLRAAEYTPQVGDYVVMEKAGGWGYSPDNNGCVALIDKVATRNIIGRDPTTVYYCISGKLINPKTTSLVKFTDIPQFGNERERVFRKALPHEIPINTPQEKPLLVEEWSTGTYAVALKGHFGVFSGSDKAHKLSVGSIFTIINNNEANNNVGVKQSQYWIYKENLKWFATYDEAVQFSNRLPQFEASPTAALSEIPLEICKRKYKKGMLVRSAKEYGEYSGEFIIDVDPSEFTNTGSGVDYFASRGWLYINGKFAEILKEPKEPLTRENREFYLELERKTQYPITPESAFPVKALRKQLKIVNFQLVHEIKIVEEKLLKKTKSKLFNI